METKKAKFIRVLTESSVNKDIKECVDEWTVIDIVDKDITQCICGTVSTNHVYYKLINKLNQSILYIAFDCISKHLVDLKHFATILCKQHTYQKSGKTQKRMCHGCFKHVMDADKPSWQTICGTCYSSGIKSEPIPILGYRMCSICYIPNIDPSKGDYVDKCTPCFKNHKAELLKNPGKDGQLRDCSICHQLKIPITKPDYVDKCDVCYKLHNEASEKRQCKRCEKFNISINAAKYVDKCTTCFKIVKEEEKNGPMRACVTCEQLKIPESKPKYVTKCEECFKIKDVKDIVYVNEIPDIVFDTSETDNFKKLTMMMSKNKI